MVKLNKATEFAQSIIDSTPKEQLEDHWTEFSDTVDINIWFDGNIRGGHIHATAYPIRIDEHGYKYTDTAQVLAILKVNET